MFKIIFIIVTLLFHLNAVADDKSTYAEQYLRSSISHDRAAIVDLNGDDRMDLFFSGYNYIYGFTEDLTGLDFVDVDTDYSNSFSTNGVLSFSTLDSIGDFNADGFDDLLLASDIESSNNDAIILLGQAVLPHALTDPYDHPYLNLDASFDTKITAISSVGDVNADGFDDVVLGRADQGLTGAVQLVLGNADKADINLDSSEQVVEFTGLNADDKSGFSVSSAGDFNNDGFADFIVGSNGYNDGIDKDSGSVHLVLGREDFSNFGGVSLPLDDPEHIVFYGEDPYDNAGFSVSGVGDVNGDNFDDILIGAYGSDNTFTDAGTAYLVLGQAIPKGGLLSNPNIIKFNGAAAGGLAGYSVAGAGDVNGDGYDDFIIEAPHAVPSTVYLVRGGKRIRSRNLGSDVIGKITSLKTSGFDRSLINVRGTDVDKDGYADLLLMDNYSDPYDPAYFGHDLYKTNLIWGKPNFKSCQVDQCND